MTAFHTCENKNGKTFIIQSAPFLSQNTTKMWLTQGYYFWSEIDFYAHKWGQQAYKNNYAILRYTLAFSETNKCFDLVGSLAHQNHLEEIINKFSARIGNDVTINAIISFLRKHKEIFPFVAIRAKDQFKVNTYKFTSSSKEAISVKERHQVCVFHEAKEIIKFEEFVYPK